MSGLHADVVIAGGGPAAGLCALVLARYGLRPIIVQGVAPRGRHFELVSGQARRKLEALLQRPLAASPGAGVEIVGTRSRWSGSEPLDWSAILNPSGPGFAIDRRVLAEHLLNAAREAGAQVLSGQRVASAARHRGIWRISTTDRSADGPIATPFLVDATGMTRRNLALGGRRPEAPGIAISSCFESPAGADLNVLVLESCRDGWLYALPCERGVFVSLCMRRDQGAAWTDTLCSHFARVLRDSWMLAGGLVGQNRLDPVAGRATGPQIAPTITGDGWGAIGDAAFAPDPLSGMGIDFALRSAEFVANALLAEDRSADLLRYQREVRAFAAQQQAASDAFTREAADALAEP